MPGILAGTGSVVARNMLRDAARDLALAHDDQVRDHFVGCSTSSSECARAMPVRVHQSRGAYKLNLAWDATVLQ